MGTVRAYVAPSAVEAMAEAGVDDLSPVDMLKLLEDEAERLCEIEQKILNQLHYLQVEESVYTQAMKQLESNSGVVKEKPPEDEDDSEDMKFAEELDRELAEALKTTLQADAILKHDECKQDE